MSYALGIIPARYASTRLPGKPLVDLGGQTMIQRVVTQARQAGLARVVVATDDARIWDHVRGFGGEAVLTHAYHPSGTDRVWEAYEQLGSPPEVSCLVNIQGDEPFIQPAQIDALVALFTGALRRRPSPRSSSRCSRRRNYSARTYPKS
ncbi:MAG: NTP transferase domain-containing protein [Hymenobacter sp.]